MPRRPYLAIVLAGLIACVLDPSGAVAGEKATLYKRLGGYDAIAAVTDDFIGRLATDPALGKFFAGHSKSTLQMLRQHVVDQLCAATGGPCYYIGRDMKTAHAGLGITEAEWNTSVTHLNATFDKFGVPQAERDEFLAILGTLKGDIVEKPM
jgi:hemoglobin